MVSGGGRGEGSVSGKWGRKGGEREQLVGEEGGEGSVSGKWGRKWGRKGGERDVGR